MSHDKARGLDVRGKKSNVHGIVILYLTLQTTICRS